MLLVSKHKVVAVKIKCRMSFVWMYLQDVICMERMKYSVHMEWFLKMQSKVLYGQVSFYKKPNIFSWNKNMSSKGFFHRYLLPLLAEQ